jgi:hypothetical protein
MQRTTPCSAEIRRLPPKEPPVIQVKNILAVLFILGTPCLAVIGGIVAGILRMRGQQRLVELAQRERIAALEKGLDVSQLTLPIGYAAAFSPSQAARRRAQGLMIGGLLIIALGSVSASPCCSCRGVTAAKTGR